MARDSWRESPLKDLTDAILRPRAIACIKAVFEDRRILERGGSRFPRRKGPVRTACAMRWQTWIRGSERPASTGPTKAPGCTSNEIGSRGTREGIQIPRRWEVG